MDLINELQLSAERDDVLTVLRKARRLASKLGVDDIDDWLKAEQNGYSETEPVPSYRKINGTLVFNSNGPIPIGYGMTGRGIFDYPGNIDLDRMLVDPMSRILAMIEGVKSRKHGIFMQMPASVSTQAISETLNPLFANQVTFLLRMNTSQVIAIPDAVKDKVLDWACELERRGVRGEGLSFGENEKRAAHSIIFNIQNSQIEQLNNMGENVKR